MQNTSSNLCPVPAERPPSRFSSALARRHGGAFLVLLLALAIGSATRAVLLLKSAAEIPWDLGLAAAAGWGVLFDLATALWITLPLALLLALLPARFFSGRLGRAAAHLGLGAILALLFFGAVAEWFFWDEFGVRANFIAVDYLVYTTEVLGNIRESYPMPAIYAGIGLAAAAGLAGLVRTRWIARWLDHAAQPAGVRWRAAGGWALAALGLGLALRQDLLPSFANNYQRELAKNGLWSFVAAFRANQLEYDRFYPTLPIDVAFRRTRDRLAQDGSKPLTDNPRDLLRLVPAPRPGPEQRLNVIQITVESLSADFLGAFNRASRLTPNLDALAGRSLIFGNFYATGTRTDRGMEALTLSVPPTPGRSLVKRPDNERLFSLGSVFRSKGYATAFVYGGFGYFDNMNYFFGENGYRVVDRTKVAAADITFANVWGACDEDLFRWALREADRDHADGKPFFHFVMTTSNHRPFTYPEGKIDLPSKISGRAGAVKYTDHAIGAFLRAAAEKPWYRETIFVIVADHCASSAGKTELPVQNYRIPLLIYAPGGQVAAGTVATLTSQVDYAPTLLGLLNWSYPSRFYGRDVLTAPDRPGRAWIGNYQKLGLFDGARLGVLKPPRQAVTFRYDAATHALTPQAQEAELIDDAIAAYQTASWLFRHGGQREYDPAHATRNVAAAAP
ncbi:MAG: sulfatase-like hydrolase/transferase [Opitutaceae bacterium]|nr:sulfatase-like hydrolase/transferase [Opitutaceae bacterium]